MKLKATGFLGSTSETFNAELSTISLVNYNEWVSEEWHFHHNTHLSLILQGGNLESRKKGNAQVSPGSIILYNQGEIHRNRFTVFPSKNLNIELENFFFVKNNLTINNLHLSNDKKLDNYFNLLKVYNEIRLNDSYSFESINFLLISLFTPKKTSSYKPLWVKKLREIIEDRWDEFIPLNELALELGVHPVTVSKYFRKYYDDTLGGYMRKVKIQRALSFLIHTKKPITEIAYICGFSDHSHMDRLFKIYVGFKPKDIRQI